ncbi:hypothetical protein CERZMDRAFT_92546 [Cercospora zeae-maydis SCOH1-5]|uniref:Uncharacterized protein n=1 Tax=Cercospora zeae-maydis SCOH1-5 TaxID=717836 RepID=A0A6A6FWY0_9PEZI|nr:hypothetical protein CERZMDRAFT_92546 [Cercospora zeae-maydis SCOH1-5]
MSTVKSVSISSDAFILNETTGRIVMAERRSTRIKIPTAKVRKASKSPSKATRPPPTPPSTPQTTSKHNSILEKPKPRKKKSPVTKPNKTVPVPPLPSLPSFPTRPPPPPPRPSDYPEAYLWTPLPQTPLAFPSSGSSARRAKLLLQGLKHRHDFHFHALRPAKERVVVYRNSVDGFWDELLRLQGVRRERGYDYSDTAAAAAAAAAAPENHGWEKGKGRETKSHELKDLDKRIGEVRRWIEEAGDKLEDARDVLSLVERRLEGIQGEWYEILFDENNQGEGGVQGLAVENPAELGEDESDLDQDADIDSILLSMDLSLAFMTQLGACLEHRAFVNEISNQFQATQAKTLQLHRELTAARGEVENFFPQSSQSLVVSRRMKRRGSGSGVRGTSTTKTRKDAGNGLSAIRIARLLGALVSIRRREQDLEVLLSNAEEYGRDLDKELCMRAVIGMGGEEEAVRSPADTIAMLSPSSPLYAEMRSSM